MPVRWFDRVLLLPAVLAVACAPLPTHVYVAEPGVGTTLFSTCAFNAHVPVGLTFGVSGIDAIIHLGTNDGRTFLEMRLDVPEGKTVVLQSASIEVATLAPKGALRAEFPSASLVDTPIINSLSSVPSVRSQQLPPTAALVGGKVQAGNNLSSRHFWFATYIDIGSAEVVLVTLPDLMVNGALSSVPRIHFSRKSMMVVATINC